MASSASTATGIEHPEEPSRRDFLYIATGSVAAVGALSSTSRPASAGDILEFFGTGMGPTKPAAPDGVVFSKSYPAANLAAFQMTIGGQAATVSFAGLVGAGLYQVNVQVPSGLSGGDQPVVLTVAGIAVQPNLKLTIAA